MNFLDIINNDVFAIQYPVDGGPPIGYAHHLNCRHFKFNCSPRKLQQELCRVLNELDEIKLVEFDAKKWSYHVEYGSKPMHRQLGINSQSYYENMMVFLDAAYEATQWFPHNEAETNDDGGRTRRWADIRIRIFTDPQTIQTIMDVDTTTTDSDTASLWWVISVILAKINDEFFTWEARKAYVGLAQGTASAQGTALAQGTASAGQEDKNAHITRYAFNEYVMRDICTYLDHP